MKSIVRQEKILSEIIDGFKVPTIAQIKALELFLTTTSSKINSDEKDLIALTLNSCNTMQNMIENFSFISKLNFEKLKLNYKIFNFSNLIKKCICENEILLKYSNLKINLTSEIKKEIYADEAKIKKVIENIFSYVINSAFKDSTIQISSNEYKNRMNFEITYKSFKNNDDIIEIFSHNQEYSSKYLELFIVKEIIKAHFGKIIFQNLENNDTIIGFVLPLN